MIAQVAEVAGEPRLPEGVTLREVAEPRDLERIAALEKAIRGVDHGWLPENLGAERDADADAIAIVVAEAGDEVLCAAWVRFEHGTASIDAPRGGRGVARVGLRRWRSPSAVRQARRLLGRRVVAAQSGDASAPMATREATCHCGQLRLEVEGDPFVVSMCHCLACQRRTGSAFGMQAAYTQDQVNVVGRFRDYSRISDEADRKEHVFHFCPDCG